MSRTSLVLAICVYLPAAFSQVAPMTQIKPVVVALPPVDGRVAVVHVAPRFSTAIRMPEAVNSVVLGDPTAFAAEHSEQESTFVFVKSIVDTPAQSNLHVVTKTGRQISVLLVSGGDSSLNDHPVIHVGVQYRSAGPFLIAAADYPTSFIAETVPLGAASAAASAAAVKTTAPQAALDALLARQRAAPLPKLYGRKPDVSVPGDDLVKCGVSEVLDSGHEVAVLFSVVNPQKQAVELMPPQVQLGGKIRSGKLIKRSKWSTAEQFPISDYRLSARRLAPGARADGVVVFSRPPYKQSNETLFLQIAESGGVDRPALAPIGFGITLVQAQELPNGNAHEKD